MFRLSNIAIALLCWAGVLLLGVLLATAVTGCMTDPSQWRPIDHMQMSRNCRVVCRPGEVRRYDSMDGSCECQSTQVRRTK